MIQNQDISSLFILIILLVFYFFQIFERVKLVYLFRSIGYHFRNILVPYNIDDMGISGSGTSVINYFHYFYIFFFLLINGVIITYYGAWDLKGNIKFTGMSNNLFISLLNSNLLILFTLLMRFLLIRYVLEIFISNKLKLIFYKNFIVNIIIALMMLLNFFIYVLNSFYDYSYLISTFLILFTLHFIFQTKNYLSYFSRFELKETIYFILYLCCFKLAPWLWLYSIV